MLRAEYLHWGRTLPKHAVNTDRCYFLIVSLFLDSRPVPEYGPGKGVGVHPPLRGGERFGNVMDSHMTRWRGWESHCLLAP